MVNQNKLETAVKTVTVLGTGIMGTPIGKNLQKAFEIRVWAHGVAESLTIAKELVFNPELVVDVVTGGPVDNPYFQTSGLIGKKSE
ncbi:hypothetical protein [Alkalihalobacillus sp. TS-13]|uniref:hypothetical protein n=1 Tax=Alkalihalobacillus sp. TS-13 TaxID=2842455 RepID=UPI001C86BFB9|nr:hypothetical protein [Alkalihalobacillus sp. TS-13]